MKMDDAQKAMKKKKSSAKLREALTQSTLENKKKNVEHAFLKKFQRAAEKVK